MKALILSLFLFLATSSAFADRPNEDSIVEAWLRFQGMYVTDVIVNNADDLRYRFTHREVYFERGNSRYNCYIKNIVMQSLSLSYQISPLEFSQCEDATGEAVTLAQIEARHVNDHNNNIDTRHVCPNNRFAYVVRTNTFECNGDGYISRTPPPSSNRRSGGAGLVFLGSDDDNDAPPVPPPPREMRRGGSGIVFIGEDD